MEVLTIADGLWRWTAPHPDWEPDANWPRDVGCVYFEGPEAVVLIDPLVPGDDEDRFWDALDRDVERIRRPVVVLVTVRWHERSAATVASRYDARVIRRGDADALPAGTEVFETDQAENEWVFWIPAHRALVPGDVLIVDEVGLRVCPFSWLADGADPAAFVASLQPLGELGVERVLVSHGEPVLRGGETALREALAQAHHSSATD